MYRLSPYCVIVDNGEDNIVFHSLFGNPVVADQKAISWLRLFENPQSEILPSDGDSSLLLDFIVDDRIDERSVLAETNQKHMVALQSGELVKFLSLSMVECCNFACSYCFAETFRNERYPVEKKMSRATAEKAIDAYAVLARKNGNKSPYFNFGGGEPLMNFDVIFHAVEYCKERYSDLNFTFVLNTNASLVTAEIAQFLGENQFRIATSIDGVERWNDQVRRTSSGGGTFKQIIAGIALLRHHGCIVDGFSATVTEKNFDGLTTEFLDWSKSNGFTDLSINLDAVMCRSIPVHHAVEKMMALKRYARQIGVSLTGFWMRPIENMFPENDFTAFCGGKRGNSMCVSPSGDILLCGYSAQKVGNVLKPDDCIPNDKYQSLVCSEMIGQNNFCAGCLIEGQCAGGCLITSEYAKKSSQSAHDFNCEFYRQMTFALLRDQTAI